MPDRIIRERRKTDPMVDRLSDRAERLFWRLQVVADDYGCFDADPRVILGSCFPLKVGVWHPDEMVPLCDELAHIGPNGEPALLTLYSVSGRRYGQMRTWKEDQRVRQSKPKFPFPTDAVLPKLAAVCGKSRQLAAYSESRESYPRDERRES